MNEYLAHIEKELSQYDFGLRPAELYDPIRYVLALGGKRIRPVLTLMASELFCGDFRQAVYPALAVEVFHNFTLLHDDIMDKAPLRRGQATVHEKWNDNIAILSGDVMLIRAYELFLKSDHPELKLILRKFNECAAEVCEGQQLDMNYETMTSVSEDEYIEMIRLKTAVLLAFSLELGAILGSATQENREKLYEFGINIGLGFQLKDDLLDVYGEADKFGKQVGGDIISNKKTYLLIKAREQAKGENLVELEYWLYQKTFDPTEKVKAVKAIYEKLGIRELGEQKMNRYFDRAINTLDELDIVKERKQPILTLTRSLIDREK
ncbi:MAG: polyprenyl synthetase family protein [Cyclobacteriaceae bacterium]|nr:polyprenyl synthetase family protein [Cyclobacteriaceae bacterium]